MRWQCGRGTYAQTLAPSAATALTSLALNTRRTRHQTTRTVFLSRSDAVDTCSTSIVFSDGSRRVLYVRSAIRNGNSRRSSVFRGMEASLSRVYWFRYGESSVIVRPGWKGGNNRWPVRGRVVGSGGEQQMSERGKYQVQLGLELRSSWVALREAGTVSCFTRLSTCCWNVNYVYNFFHHKYDLSFFTCMHVSYDEACRTFISRVEENVHSTFFPLSLIFFYSSKKYIIVGWSTFMMWVIVPSPSLLMWISAMYFTELLLIPSLHECMLHWKCYFLFIFCVYSLFFSIVSWVDGVSSIYIFVLFYIFIPIYVQDLILE